MKKPNISRTTLLCLLAGLCLASNSSANPPIASYIFPAGGQRGSDVNVRVGGLFLHDQCEFELKGSGLKASRLLVPAKRLWFEGPVLPLPESQKQEDYPLDMQGRVSIDRKAPLGPVRGRVFTSEGGAGGLVFVVGELPEVIEEEVDGDPLPETITLPVTANGRIFPREDIDLWEFQLEAGKPVTAYVHAGSLNSPLIAQIEILDSSGKVVAEQMQRPCVGTDTSIKFTPNANGKYRLRIKDARTLGGQEFVYRLTVTAAEVPDYHFPLKAPPDGLTNITEPAAGLRAPVAINGRIDDAKAVGEWKIFLKQEIKWAFDLQARRYDSPLSGIVTIRDAAGKELLKAESVDPLTDPAVVLFSPPVDGIYTVRVAERFRGRAGPDFIYRLRVFDSDTETTAQGFRLTIPSDTLTVTRGSTLKLKVSAERYGGFRGPIMVSLNGLPDGVTTPGVLISSKQTSADLILTAGATARITHHPLRITGTGIGGIFQRMIAEVHAPASRIMPGTPDLQLAVGLAVPFKIVNRYVMTSAPRGETYRRSYTLDRGGVEGPIHVQLADKQARHLQGVTGTVMTLKADQTEFEYPVLLPPWMELGRTCRVCVMATAKVKDPLDGTEHTVSFSSTEQNQQMIVVVGPGRLDVVAGKTSVRAVSGKEVRLPIQVTRAKDLEGSVKVEALIPEHWQGVRALPLNLPPGEDHGELILRFDADYGPFNAPLVIRATLQTQTTPVIAEVKVDVVK